MAMVLDAFASYLGHLLTQVAADELGTMLGVSGEIDKMGDKLMDLKNFLADADRRNITDESVREWVGQLKRAMYEATNILDLCQLKAMEHGASSVDAGCFNPLLFCMRNPSHARDIGTRIKALNKRLDNIKQRSAAFSFINLGPYEDPHNSKVHASRHGNCSRETSPDLDRLGVVGDQIKEDTRTLVAQIMETRKEVNNNIMVVAIVGVGGIGKTTLAQKVFNDEAIQGEFSKKIWLSVNQNFSEAELLTRAIIEAGGQPAGNAKAALHRTLKDALTGHKTLLVMDDVWNDGAWEGVLKIPLVNSVASGSRVLITTRDDGVARGMTATWPYHHIDILGHGDAWSLLKKQVLSSEIDEDHINTLKDIGLKIIQKCGGLPLAVKVMGGVLRKRGALRRDWEQVLDDSKWSLTKMPRELNNAVYLSYEDMAPYLKQCFLYYSLLPQSKPFPSRRVIAMWISEGFIHGSSNNLEELGENYYKELISRNLLEPVTSHVDPCYCRMHDVVRSFAQYMNKDEVLITQDGDIDILTKLHPQKFLRLSIETNRLHSGELDWESLREQQSVRTLISIIQIKIKTGDSLVTFSCLRTLHIEYADVTVLVESLHQLKHLRYLALVNTDISVLPVKIGKMKLLQFLDLEGCQKLFNLPDSIVKLGQLRLLYLHKISTIPRGFRGLTCMRTLCGFPAYMDGAWCSLDELGPLSQLRVLGLHKLENVSAASFAANAKLGGKVHLIELLLVCTSKLGDDGLVKEKEGVSEEEQRQIENVFDELCPPSSVETLVILGYFGQQLPSWMMSTSTVSLKNLKVLFLCDLAYCTQFPNGLCQLPCLQFLQVSRAPCIRRIGIGFLKAAVAPFPMLKDMLLAGMVEWEEWEWEEQVQAMSRLDKLLLRNCKLKRVPPGLASNARALKKLILQGVQNLSYLGNFPSVVELMVNGIPDLERITNLPCLQKLAIINCSKLKVLDCIPALDRLGLEDYAMEKLPEYMRHIKSRHLQLDCRVWLLAQLTAGQSGTEWDKFSHVEHVKAYAPDGYNRRKWYVLYTRRENFKLDSNISSSTVFQETLSSSMEGTHGFESVYEMRKSTFTYVCSLVRIPILEDMMARDHTFIDGRMMSLQDRVAVALRMLRAGEPQDTIGSSVGVHDSTASLLTQRFVDAMCKRAHHHMLWPGSAEMERIKRKFDKIYGLPNCCGVVYTAHIKFGSENHDHEENDGVLMQVVVDPDMRFTNIWFGSSSSMNQSSTLHDSGLFKSSEVGTCLNGSKLKLSDGSDAGEYIIGDAGYPLRPWLLTPYQLESADLSLSDPEVEFNRRVHSAATTVAQKAQARLLDTWKRLQGEGWRPNNQHEMRITIKACCLLHNILIGIPSYQQESYAQQVRQIADEDAVRMRDALSQHMIKSGETLPSSMVDAQITKVGRRTFTYLCSLVGDHTFVEGRVLSLEDRVAIALRMLNSGEPLVTVGSSLGVKESTVLLVTQGFVEAMSERAIHYLLWPDSTEMERIKRKFDKIHGLPNCCGVVYTAYIKFGSEDHDHEENDGMLMQVVVDPDMRFTNIWFGSSSSMNQSSTLHDSWLLRSSEDGACLNGSKLKLSDGLDVGEYIIGDAGYPLRPWLLTPYQLERDLPLSDSEVEFNRRVHSAATTVAQKAQAQLLDMWKCLQGEGWRPNNQHEMRITIKACCLLHNILIGIRGYQQKSYAQQVRQIADEDAVRMRDALSQHMIKSGETLPSSMVDAQITKVGRRTFTYLCSLVRDQTFVEGRVLSLEDRVAIALRMLNSGEPLVTVGSSLGVKESTVLLVTQGFVEAMSERAIHYLLWPDSTEMDRIKRKFDKIHGLPNCCGVVYTAHIKFGSEDRHHEENDGMLMQVVVDPHMRFTNIWFGSSSSMNQSSTLHDSWLLKYSEDGACLNGSKLKLSDGLDVGEYIIGDAGYPLRPWLLTPYQLERDLSLSDSEVEFNRRVHSAATTVAQKAQAQLLDMWKSLQGEGWRPNNQHEMRITIKACCLLHNILIGIRGYQQESYAQQVRQIADEDAVRMRDALSQHMIKSGEILPSSMVDAQIEKVGRRTFTYLCSLVRDQTFVEGRVLSLQDRVGIALRVLGSGEPLITVGSSLGVEESTVFLVTQGFVEAMIQRAIHNLHWPGSAKIERIKRKFDKIYGLPNCCGVVHTALIKFGSQYADPDLIDGVLFQALVDPDMRFTNIFMVSSVGMNKLSLFHDSPLFKECKNGAWLNGSKLQLSDGSEVGEYIIGDTGYPLLPWLLTPYQSENDFSLSDSKVEFNKRHTAVTAMAQRALARLKDTWKCLQGEGWLPNNQLEMYWMIDTCCMLHNIVITMQEEEDDDGDGEDDDGDDDDEEEEEEEEDEEEVDKDDDGMGEEDKQEEVLVDEDDDGEDQDENYMEAEESEDEDEDDDEDQDENHIEQVRQLADEDAFSVRDALSQHMIKSGVHTVAAEEEQEVVADASSSGDENKEGLKERVPW